MTAEEQDRAAPAPALELPPLDKRERRILGVLVEKAFCTPDQYPLTVNALVSGCNQKSNRDPVTSFSADQIDEALIELLRKSLVIRVMPASGRTDRWKHQLKEAWILDRAERAVLAELFLRGAQTEGELRSRASRMVEIPSLEELRSILERLQKRGFVVRLTPEGRSRGVAWTHRAQPEADIEQQRQALATSSDATWESNASESGVPCVAARPNLEAEFLERFERIEAELAAVREELESLKRIQPFAS